MRRIFFLTIISFYFGCADKPYQEERVEKEEEKLIVKPKLEFTSNIESKYVTQKGASLSGEISNVDWFLKLQVRYLGLDEENKNIDGVLDADINMQNQTWKAKFEDELEEGKYQINIVVIKKGGEELLLEQRDFIFDFTGPNILGANDGIAQQKYTQEGSAYRQEFSEVDSAPQYSISSVGNVLNFRTDDIPTIYRWSTNLNVADGAPSYSFAVSDNINLKGIRYHIGGSCVEHQDAKRELDLSKTNQYAIKIIQNNASADLSKSSSKLCLSIWALDDAGHASNHNFEFAWKVTTPPLAVDMNSKFYRNHKRSDDFSASRITSYDLFYIGQPPRLLKNRVLGHAIIANPFSETLLTRLNFEGAVKLRVQRKSYQIPANKLAIDYFVYDLANDEIKHKLGSTGNLIALNKGDVVLAKFRLIKDFVLSDLASSSRNFWNGLQTSVSFNKVGDDLAIVDGLTIEVLPFEASKESQEYEVPWGKRHKVKKRNAGRIAN